VVATAGALLHAVSAPAAAEATGFRSHESAAKVRGYWTPKRMAEAKPMPVPSTASPPGVGPPARAAPDAGRPGSIAPAPPTGPDALTRVPTTKRVDSGLVADQRSWPQSTNGKLFFVQGRYRYECSASVPPSQSHSVILTAGHCVYGPGGWSRKITFVPAYDRGARPFGTWSWRYEAVPRQWWRIGNWNYDYAAIKLKANSRGRVGSVVGEQGIAWNYPRRQDYRIIGYPHNISRGRQMWSCQSSFRRVDGKRLSGPPATGVDCNLGAGASGGGWSFYDTPGDGPYLGSVTSHSLRGVQGILFGPYFTANVNRLIGRVNRN
jgi:V8-like Glu-specific endopeptidase